MDIKSISPSHRFREYVLRDVHVSQCYAVAYSDFYKQIKKDKQMSYEFSDGYKIRNQYAPHFLTFTIVGWIDLFSRQSYRDLILKSFQYCQKEKGLKIGAYVIMSNHIHCIWTATNGNLSDIIRDFKTYTSKQIIASIETESESRREWLRYMFAYFAKGTNGNKYDKVWRSGNHPEELNSEDFIVQKLNYIHENPVRTGIVRNATDYIYSSAIDYTGEQGCLQINFIL